mmetsp:Transcript_124956/g.347902  ORF Transcript_124956/g.347902 Transcript_124956/m.347902 type:complete len:408 (+) Transcript_124956:109-1332(+)
MSSAADGGSGAMYSAGAPEGEDAAGRRRRRRTARHLDEFRGNGLCFCKMLVPDKLAGAIIGRQGMTIAQIELLSGCKLRVSGEQCFFPGTNERIVVMGGAMQSLQGCIRMVLQRSQECRGGHKDRPLVTRLVVPNSSTLALIELTGRAAAHSSSSADCTMNISPRVGDLGEHIVQLSGNYDSVVRGTAQVCLELQADPNLAKHLCLRYSGRLPPGARPAAVGTATEPRALLPSPAGAVGHSEREPLEHTRGTVPREVPARHSPLHTGIQCTAENRSSQEMARIVAETWFLRDGDPAMAAAGGSPEEDGAISDQESMASTLWSAASAEMAKTQGLALPPFPVGKDSDPLSKPNEPTAGAEGLEPAPLPAGPRLPLTESFLAGFDELVADSRELAASAYGRWSAWWRSP